MTIVKEKCAMFGCEQLFYQALTVAPGTVLKLCLKHFVEEGGVVVEEVAQAGPQTSSMKTPISLNDGPRPGVA